MERVLYTRRSIKHNLNPDPGPDPKAEKAPVMEESRESVVGSAECAGALGLHPSPGCVSVAGVPWAVGSAVRAELSIGRTHSEESGARSHCAVLSGESWDLIQVSEKSPQCWPSSRPEGSQQYPSSLH